MFRPTEINWYKWSEANFRPTVLCKRAWMSTSTWAHHIKVAIYQCLDTLLYLFSNIIIKIVGLSS